MPGSQNLGSSRADDSIITGLLTLIQTDTTSIIAAIGSGALECNVSGSFVLDIPNAGVADRVQLTDVACKKINIQSHPSNKGKIYVGGITVTNALGINEGIDLDPGDTYGPLLVENCNVMYVSAEIGGDDVKVIWLNKI